MFRGLGFRGLGFKCRVVLGSGALQVLALWLMFRVFYT